MINEAIIPTPSRVILVKNTVTKKGLRIMKELFPDSLKSHGKATKKAEKFIANCHQTDYRSDSRIIHTDSYGDVIISFTQFYWYKGNSPECTTISFNVGSSDVIEVYDFVVDTTIFAKEISKKYKTKVQGKTSIPITANNSFEQKKFPKLVEIGNWAKKYFDSLPIIQDKTLDNANSMSYLYVPEDVKRLYDYQFFEWNQFAEAEYFAKKYYLQGYDVYRGLNSVGQDSIMIYILKNKNPIPIFKRRWFTNAGMEKQGT